MAKDKSKETDEPKKRASRKPTAIVYKEGNTVTVALAHPDKQEARLETGNGIHEVLGRYKDKGYDFGPLKDNECPPWATKHLPKGASLIGCVPIKAFPWV